MERLEEMQHFFDTRSESYDQVHVAGISGGIYSKDVVASYLPAQTRTILDLGVGTGLELRAIYQRFPEAQVTGLDLSAKMLDKLREKYADRKIILHQESYLSFPYPAEAYDAAVSVMSLHHYNYPVKLALYRKLYGALAPNGVYVECDYMLSENEYEDPQAQEDLLFEQYLNLVEEQRLDPGKEYHFDTPCTVENQMKMLQEAGFDSVEEVWQEGNTVILVAKK